MNNDTNGQVMQVYITWVSAAAVSAVTRVTVTTSAPPSCSAPATTLAQCSEEDEVVLVDDGGEQLQGNLARHRQLLQAPV